MKRKLHKDILIGVLFFIAGSAAVFYFAPLSNLYKNETASSGIFPVIEIALLFFIIVSVLGIRYAFLFYSYVKTTEQVSFMMRRKEQMQSEQNKLTSLGELAGGLAHEINNALQPILGLSEIIQRRLKKTDQEELIENIDMVVERAKYVRKIVQNMLTFARKKNVEKLPTLVDAAITESVGFAKQYLPATNSVDVAYKNKNIINSQILVDKVALIQVMLNIFLNAAHAMKDKGTTMVEVDTIVVNKKEGMLRDIKKGEYLKIDVIDMGPGIDKEIMSSIFNPFFTTKQNQGGTGLGLSTC